MSLTEHRHPGLDLAGITQAGVFLVGAERSGTTMLRLMLDHHSKIAWANEFEYVVDRVSESGDRPIVAEFASWLGEHRIFNATGFKIDQSLEYDALVRSFLMQRGESSGKLLVGATVHRHFDRLLEIWPDAKFVHLVRDPRDVSPSVIKMGWAGTVYHACQRWVDAERVWDRIADTLPSDRILSIRFEDLLADPPAVLSSICSFIGIEYDDSMLSYDQDTTYDSADPSASQRWRNTLSSRDVGLIEGKASDLIQSRGYELSGHKQLHPGAMRRLLLGLQDRMGRAHFRIHKYGFRLWLSALVTKRFSPRSKHIEISQKMKAIDREHLR